MTFYMPTRVYEEPDCVAAHAAELATLGTKAMLVTGRHSAKANGSEADVTAALDAQNVPYCIFNEIEENPSIETVSGARRCRLLHRHRRRVPHGRGEGHLPDGEEPVEGRGDPFRE